MRYRRYYSHENPGGSTTVTSYGPITTEPAIRDQLVRALRELRRRRLK